MLKIIKKEIPGYSRYLATTTGSIIDKSTNKEIPQTIARNYYCVNVYSDYIKEVSNQYTHKLLVLAFLGCGIKIELTPII